MAQLTMVEEVRRLVAADKIEAALKLLLEDEGGSDELKDELIAHQARLARARKQGRRGLLSADDESQARTHVGYAVLELLAPEPGAILSQADGARGRADDREPVPAAPTVFISYNHSDADVADRVRRALEEAGIQVLIDRFDMQAGQDIETFIRASISDTDVTLCIISGRSLLSAWVALETITTLAHEDVSGRPRFIGCYIEDEFFRPDFLLQATDRIDERIAEIDALIPEYAARTIDTVDLNGEKSRLFKLRSNLGDFLARLRGSLTLDIRDDRFDESLSKIVKTLQA